MTTGWKIPAVLVAAALSGCATKGDLEALRTQVAATQSSAQASETSIKSIEEKLSAHETRLAEAEKSESAAADRLAELAQTQSQVVKQLADLDVRLKALDDNIAKAAGRMDKDEAQITALTGQANAWDTDLKLVKDEMVKLNGTVAKASQTYRKNLENMRDIYKRQFEAVSEMLEKEKE